MFLTQWPTRGLKFWPGYPHSNPRYGTRAFEPVGSTGWETGSYRLRNIGIGSAVSVWMGLVVRPCSAMEARGLGSPTLGRKGGIQGKKGIADEL